MEYVVVPTFQVSPNTCRWSLLFAQRFMTDNTVSRNQTLDRVGASSTQAGADVTHGDTKNFTGKERAQQDV